MKPDICKKCPYNIPKARGGYGHLCNGYTMKKWRRCPQWVINERKKKGLMKN